MSPDSRKRRNLRRHQGRLAVVPRPYTGPRLVKCVGCRAKTSVASQPLDIQLFGEWKRGPGCDACIAEYRRSPVSHAPWGKSYPGESDRQQARFMKRVRKAAL